MELKHIEEKCIYCRDEYEAVSGADALLIITDGISLEFGF